MEEVAEVRRRAPGPAGCSSLTVGRVVSTGGTPTVGVTSRKAALWAARGDLGHLHSGGRPWPWERLELMCAGAITSVIWSKSPGCAEPASRL